MLGHCTHTPRGRVEMIVARMRCENGAFPPLVAFFRKIERAAAGQGPAADPRCVSGGVRCRAAESKGRGRANCPGAWQSQPSGFQDPAPLFAAGVRRLFRRGVGDGKLGGRRIPPFQCSMLDLPKGGQDTSGAARIFPVLQFGASWALGPRLPTLSQTIWSDQFCETRLCLPGIGSCSNVEVGLSQH